MLMAALSCPTPTITNNTDTWTKFDQTTLENAEKRCGEIYSDAPCLKTFIKKPDGVYDAICGAE